MKSKFVIIVLVLMAISLPIASRLVKQNQDNRNRAMELVPNIPCSKVYGCMRGLDTIPPNPNFLKSDCTCGEINTIEGINDACGMCKTPPVEPDPICEIPQCPVPLIATCPEGVDCIKECDKLICLPKSTEPIPPIEPPPIEPPIDPGPVKFWQCRAGECVESSETMCRLNPLDIDSKPCIVGEQCPVGYCGIGSSEPLVMCDGQAVGSIKCLDRNLIVKCNSIGQWVQYKDCVAEGPNMVCMAGKCAPVLEDCWCALDGKAYNGPRTRCDGNIVKNCPNVANCDWKTLADCSETNQICENGECIEKIPEIGSCSTYVCKKTPERKGEGDADCDTFVKNNDFEIWRREFVATIEMEGGWMADFECVDKVSQPDIGDFEVWRRNYIKGLN